MSVLYILTYCSDHINIFFYFLYKHMYKAHRPKATNKFFTDPKFALECINKVFNLFPKDDFSLIVDPGAGNGSFFK